MKRKIKWLIISFLALVIIFVGSFIGADIYLEYRDKASNNVTSSSNNNEKKLGNNLRISLYQGDNKEKDLSMEQVKNELGIEGELTEEVLSKELQKQGYELEAKSSDKLSYTRSAESSIEPNKYYIVDYDGHIAIGKSNDKGDLFDEKGNPYIEDKETDVFDDRKSLKDLPEIDQEKIKSYGMRFDSKAEAEESISELIS